MLHPDRLLLVQMLDRIDSVQATGCFALTELGFGYARLLPCP